MWIAGVMHPASDPRGTRAASAYNEGGRRRGRKEAPSFVARARNAKYECNEGVCFKIALL